MRHKPLLLLFSLIILLAPQLSATPSEAASTNTTRGPAGQQLRVSASQNLNPRGTWVTVSGKNFDERVGIYVTYCKIVKRGAVPTPCGAGIDMTGSTKTSVWVSSNAPLPLRPLVTEYSPGGKFKVRIRVVAITSEINCLKYRCAITTKSDHLNLDSTRNNITIPISFSSKGMK